MLVWAERVPERREATKKNTENPSITISLSKWDCDTRAHGKLFLWFWQNKKRGEGGKYVIWYLEMIITFVINIRNCIIYFKFRSNWSGRKLFPFSMSRSRFKSLSSNYIIRTLTYLQYRRWHCYHIKYAMTSSLTRWNSPSFVIYIWCQPNLI